MTVRGVLRGLWLVPWALFHLGRRGRPFDGHRLQLPGDPVLVFCDCGAGAVVHPDRVEPTVRWCPVLEVAGWSPLLRRWLVSIGKVRSWRIGTRRGRWRLALSIGWFTVGLASVIAAELTYGWRPAPIEHPWHAAAYLVLMSWLWVGTRLHRGARS